MRHLTKQQVQEAVMLYETGVVSSMSELARRFDCHHTTIAYHIHKHNVEHSSDITTVIDIVNYDPELELLRRKQALCQHPSTKCSLCGKYEDLLKTEEREKTREMTRRIRYLEGLLRKRDIYFERQTPMENPVYTL